MHICTEPEPEPDQYSIFNIVSLSGDAGEKSLNIIGGDKLRISGELENWTTPHVSCERLGRVLLAWCLILDIGYWIFDIGYWILDI